VTARASAELREAHQIGLGTVLNTGEGRERHPRLVCGLAKGKGTPPLSEHLPKPRGIEPLDCGAGFVSHFVIESMSVP
jgi:hypothetical protein